MSPGFGLFEVLASLTLIALAMLGVIHGLSSAHLQTLESEALAYAVLQAENMFEQMQANPLGVKQGAYFQMPGSSPACNPCTPAQQAAKDLARWQEQLSEQLTAGEGEIVPYGNGQKIIIRWHSLLEHEAEPNEWALYADL